MPSQHCVPRVNTMTNESTFIIQRYISSFMTFYREHFPHATVTPKMHMLEVDWLDEWQVGIGLMGEQGAESIHAYFNNLKTTYRSIPNGVERLRCMMKKHFVHIAPSTVLYDNIYCLLDSIVYLIVHNKKCHFKMVLTR